MPTGIFITLFGYLLGSVPTGIVLTRLFSRVDPRKMGSKNIGATNIYRTAGKTLGSFHALRRHAEGSPSNLDGHHVDTARSVGYP